MYFLHPSLMYFFKSVFSSSLATYPGVELVVVLSWFWGPSIVFIGASQIHSPINSVGGFSFLTSSASFVLCRLCDDGHSDWCEVRPHCGFDLHFSDDMRCWTYFHVPVGHLYVFFGKMPMQVFCLVFIWVVWFFDVEFYELFIYFGY